MDKVYICIDLKSFFASVECVARGLDPMTANLAVADLTRTEKTICLAVSPAMKKAGVRNRCRAFEIPDSVPCIIAPPRMQLYIDTAADIYELYLRYISPADIHVYSIDEAFLDITEYLNMYNKTPHEMAAFLLDEIYSSLGFRASCGIGTNMYLAKIALDILAKHSPNFTAYLNEEQYRRILWRHTPITDFWMIGRGMERQLKKLGITTMEQLAKAPNELIMKKFGVNGRILMEHAWGKDNTTIRDIKEYIPKGHSLSSSQVLGTRCSRSRGQILLHETADKLCLDMTAKGLRARTIGISVSCTTPSREQYYINKVKRLQSHESRYSVIKETADNLYNSNVPDNINIHIIGMSLGELTALPQEGSGIFDDGEAEEKEMRLQRQVCSIRQRFGANSLMKAASYLPEATAKERNMQIGGHRR